MKLEMDLIRKMVLAVEDAPTGFVQRNPTIEGYTPEQIGYHAYQLIDGGLAEGPKVGDTRSTGPDAIISNLTWRGHEFAAAARNETTWKKVMIIVRDKGGSVTLPIVIELLKLYMRSNFGLG